MNSWSEKYMARHPIISGRNEGGRERGREGEREFHFHTRTTNGADKEVKLSVLPADNTKREVNSVKLLHVLA